MSRRPNELVVVAWNCYVGNSDRNVLAYLAELAALEAPDVFALTEAQTHADVLGEFAMFHGYTLLQETPNPRRKRGRVVDDTGDCALLVADRHKVRRDWVDAMTRTWMVLRYKRRHAPHRYQVALLTVRGRKWRVRASHWPTHGFDGPNGAAVKESAKGSKRWLRRGTTPSVDVGDLNEKISRLAAWYGQRFQVYGERIDVAVTRNVADCVWSELDKGGSDHHGRLYRFTA